MSVINKMLQDLDARGLQTARSDFSSIRSVPEGSRRLETRALIVLVTIALVALAGLAVWRFSAVPAEPVPVSPLVQLASMVPLANAAPLVEATPLAEVITVAPAVAPSVAAAPQPKVVTIASASERPVRVASRTNAERLDPPQRSAPRVVRAEAAVRAPVVESRTPVAQSRMNNASSAGSVTDNTLQMKQANPRQEAENEYRKALALIQEGRVTAGIGGLEHVLTLSPRHDAARQTLIGLLLEGQRPDEAILRLEQGLALDAGQTSMAMALARLQVERRGPALQTLQRSLPYATERADYLSFVAALLQREKRHKEAIEHYQAALRLNPGNGLWWMGLGISLQADDRLPEARAAFQKAKASGSLEGELPNFVDKKLQQLGR